MSLLLLFNSGRVLTQSMTATTHTTATFKPFRYIWGRALHAVTHTAGTMARLCRYKRVLAPVITTHPSFKRFFNLKSYLHATSHLVPNLLKPGMHLIHMTAGALRAGASVSRIAKHLRTIAAISHTNPLIKRLSSYKRTLSAVSHTNPVLKVAAKHLRSLVATSHTNPVLKRIVQYKRTVAAVAHSTATLTRIAHYKRVLSRSVTTVVQHVQSFAIKLWKPHDMSFLPIASDTTVLAILYSDTTSAPITTSDATQVAQPR